MISKKSLLTTYKKGGNSLNPFIKLSIFFIVLGLFVLPVSAFDDSVQRYDIDYTDVWNNNGTGTGSVTVVNMPVLYPTSNTMKFYHIGTGLLDNTGIGVKSINRLDNNYFAFTIRDYIEEAVHGSNAVYIEYTNESGVILGSFNIDTYVSSSHDNNRYEFVKQANAILLYIDGVFIANLGDIIEDSTYFSVRVFSVSDGKYSILCVDDFSTSSIIGMDAEWTQASTYIDTSYGIQSQSSFPTDEYFIKTYRISTGELINTTSLGTGATGNESGFVRWNRSVIFGSNFGLYLSKLYRESDVLASTYFSIFDTTIQGSVDWEEDSYTIADSPAIGYEIPNGDLTTYTYTLKIVDSNQQIKESYTLSSLSGIKGPSIVSYSSGIHYAVLSRIHKITGKIDDFAFDTTTISAEGVTPPSYINWGADQYTIGDTAVYTWSWAEDDLSIWKRERVVIMKDGVVLDRINAGDYGTRYLDADEIGGYSASLISYGLLTYSNPIIYATDNMDVHEPIDSFINVPQESATKTNFTATYLYGSSPINPIINIKELQNDYSYKIIDTKILPPASGGTTYTTNLSISQVGYFVIDLYDNGKGKSLATDTIQTNFVYIPPTDVILSSYIEATESTYGLGSVISGVYGMDDTNFTDYHPKLEVYNYDKDVTSFSFPIAHQLDSFDIPISDDLFYSDGENTHVVNTNFLTGDNCVRLSTYNTDGTLNEIVAYDNFTISATDSEGYSLTLSRYTVEEEDSFTIKAITPTEAVIRVHPLTLMGVSDELITVNATINFPYSIGVSDTYLISLEVNDQTKITQMLKVLPQTTILDPTVDEDDEIVTLGTIEMIITFLSMPAFWGMIIWVGVVGGVAQSNAVNRSSTGYIAFAFGNILAVVGMFAPYTMYILVILWIGAGVFFKLGREAAGSEEY